MNNFIEYLKTSNIDLNEMAFKRAEFIEKIDKQSTPLMEHTLCLLALNEISNWDSTVSNIINYISELYDIKSHRQYMTKKELMNILLYKPFKDSDEEWIERKVKRISKSKNMKIYRIPSFAEIEYFYSSILDEVQDGISRDKVKNILNTIKIKYSW